MKNLIHQIKSHAEAAKSAPDSINHLDAIIGVCGLLEQELEPETIKEETKKLVEYTRDFHRAKAKEIELERTPVDKLTAAYYERDRLQYTAAILDELLKRIEGKK